MSRAQLASVPYAASLLGIPERIRRGRGVCIEESSSPHLYGIVKSKCFAEDGSHLCSVPYHACFRRIRAFTPTPGDYNGGELLGQPRE